MGGHVCQARGIPSRARGLSRSRDYKEDPSLGMWVTRQRCRRDKLDSERIARLESIGFVWDALTNNGRKCLPSLRNIVERTGIVSFQDYKEDPSLGIWVATQRMRDLILNELQTRVIGFVWDL